VVNRFEVYAVPVATESRSYMDAVMALPAWRAWRQAAAAETFVIPADEV
jgi:glutathione S-transferase